MERETFTAYEFVGICDKEVAKSMDLQHFLEHEAIRYYVLDTKELFECSCTRFASKEMSLGGHTQGNSRGHGFLSDYRCLQEERCARVYQEGIQGSVLEVHGVQAVTEGL